MEALIPVVGEYLSQFGMEIFLPIILFGVLAIGAQWLLYEKCKLPGVACVVPVWNVIVFLQIVGRPQKHMWYVILPPLFILLPLVLWGYQVIEMIPALAIASAFFLPWAFFLITVYKEVCQSFGKYSVLSYILIVVFNGFYLFHLALSHEEKYKGPVYGKPKKA